jgi:hypothetical protein
MAYSEPEIAVLKKYRIMNPDGSLRTVDLRQPTQAGGQPPGPGPLVSPDVVNRLLKADTTPDKRWLDWIFFQAGGGQKAKEATADALRQIRDRFIDERTNGWTHPETGRYQPPVPREQAEARWVAAEPKFRDVLAVCDQDAVKRLRTFGYFRDWPGNANIYQNVVQAVTQYLKFYPKLQQMNKELAREGGDEQPENPDGIPTWERMGEIAKKVERYFASKKARTDIREETIYDDDVITALAPLTYAAAVKYGYDLWPWASRKGFEAVLAGDSTDWRFRDEWKGHTQRGSIFVYLTFKVPVPAWVTRRDGNWELKDLTDLALELSKDNVKENPDAWVVFDQENRNTLTIGQVKQMILAEPQRVDPTDEESPIKRGANVYKDEAEAQHVVNSLDRAVKTVKKWAAKFDPKAIKSDVFTLD